MATSDSKPSLSPLIRRIGLLAAIVTLAVSAYLGYGRYLELDYLAAREAELRTFQTQQPAIVYGIALAIYVGVTGLSLPGAAALSLVYGWYFGFLPGVVLVSFASTAGATAAFLLCRYLFREAVQRRFGDRLQKFDTALEQEGPFYLFTLRLVPVVPFFVINAVMGLTPISARTFWWVSQLGMLPGTFVYLYAGSRVPSLQTLADEGIRAVFTARQLAELFVAFGLVGLLPFVVRRILTVRGRSEGGDRP